MIKKYLEQFGNVHDSYGGPGGPDGPRGPTLPGGVVGVGGSLLYFKNKIA